MKRSKDRKIKRKQKAESRKEREGQEENGPEVDGNEFFGFEETGLFLGGRFGLGHVEAHDQQIQQLVGRRGRLIRHQERVQIVWICFVQRQPTRPHTERKRSEKDDAKKRKKEENHLGAARR